MFSILQGNELTVIKIQHVNKYFGKQNIYKDICYLDCVYDCWDNFNLKYSLTKCVIKLKDVVYFLGILVFEEINPIIVDSRIKISDYTVYRKDI